MTYTRSNSSLYLSSSSRTNKKYRQLLALIGVIVIGMIISSAVNAIPSSKTKSATTKSTEQVYYQKVK